ncbi:MAG: oxidoreductase [Planctomycetaceae bacterium]|nr:oxidoreductase [Planctomycetaceae bacterium]
MIEMHLPWLELAIALPVLGGIWTSLIRDSERARMHSLFIASFTLLCTIGAWQDFVSLHTFQAHDHWDLLATIVGHEVFVIDELSAPLLPLCALLYLLTELATLRTKVQRFSFPRAHFSEAILLATLSSKSPWMVIALLIAGVVPPWIELRQRKRPTRVFLIHMGLFVGLLLAGQGLIVASPPNSVGMTAGIVMLMAAVLLRSGVVPVHCWMTDLFEHASFGTSLLFVVPMVGAYATMRLVLPIAPDWALRAIALLSLITAIYAAGMSLVQRDARRFFCYLLLSHASLVLVGLEIATPVGLTGALCVWISVGLALGGFGLTLRSIEARTGRLTLGEFHGLYEHIPMLAALFLVTGLASIGFPGTLGFIGTELLVEGAVQVAPLVGAAVVLATTLNGLAVLHAYFRVFTGKRHQTSIDIRSRWGERVAVLTLILLLFGGGLWPQPGVASRFHAATELIAQRQESASPERPSGHVGKEPVSASVPIHSSKPLSHFLVGDLANPVPTPTPSE